MYARERLPYGRRRSLYANEGTLIEYENGSQVLWWDGVPIGQLIDYEGAPEPVTMAVRRLHQADVEAAAIRRERMRRGTYP